MRGWCIDAYWLARARQCAGMHARPPRRCRVFESALCMFLSVTVALIPAGKQNRGAVVGQAAHEAPVRSVVVHGRKLIPKTTFALHVFRYRGKFRVSGSAMQDGGMERGQPVARPPTSATTTAAAKAAAGKLGFNASCSNYCVRIRQRQHSLLPNAHRAAETYLCLSKWHSTYHSGACANHRRVSRSHNVSCGRI